MSASRGRVAMIVGMVLVLGGCAGTSSSGQSSAEDLEACDILSADAVESLVGPAEGQDRGSSRCEYTGPDGGILMIEHTNQWGYDDAVASGYKPVSGDGLEQAAEHLMEIGNTYSLMAMSGEYAFHITLGGSGKITDAVKNDVRKALVEGMK